MSRNREAGPIKGAVRIFTKGYRGLAMIVFNVIVAAVLIELGVQAGWDVYRWMTRPSAAPVQKMPASPVRPNKPAPVIKKKPAAKPVPRNMNQIIRQYKLERYVKEKRRVGGITVHNFWPYILWKRRPHQGRAINIGPHGERLTLNNSTDPGAVKVFCMGGSTTWGDFVTDADTYPSHLARMLGRIGKYRVYNFGQAGYNSTQSLIRLMLELRRGNRPRVVIFLSGLNDGLIGTCWPAIPGSVFQVAAIRAKMTLTYGWRTVGRVLYDNSDAIRLLRQIGVIGANPFIQRSADPELGLLTGGQRTLAKPELVKLTAEMYRQNVRMAQALARTYGFKVFFFWQPNLYLLRKKHLAPFERWLVKSTRADNSRAVALKWLPAVYAEIRRRPPASKNFFDISDMFAAYRGLLYADMMHLLPPGNRMLARRIFEKIRGRLGPAPIRAADLKRGGK